MFSVILSNHEWLHLCCKASSDTCTASLFCLLDEAFCDALSLQTWFSFTDSYVSEKKFQVVLGFNLRQRLFDKRPVVILVSLGHGVGGVLWCSGTVTWIFMSFCFWSLSCSSCLFLLVCINRFQGLRYFPFQSRVFLCFENVVLKNFDFVIFLIFSSDVAHLHHGPGIPGDILTHS
jgi:hypothetical protein